MPKAKKEADKATGNDDKKYLGFERHRLAPEWSIMQELSRIVLRKKDIEGSLGALSFKVTGPLRKDKKDKKEKKPGLAAV